MKKSILIGALAVMMLFAFTACEPQIAGVIPGGDSPVAKVTFVSANDPLREGTAPGMVNAVVDVIYKDGTSTNGVTAKMNVTSKIEPGTNVAPAVLSGEEGATSYLVSFEAATVTELAVDTEDVELSIKDTSIDVATDNSKTMLNGIVVTATYSDGFVEVVDDWTSKWNAATRANVTGATISYLSGSAEVEFEIERTPAEKATITSLVATYNDDEEVVVGQSFDPALVEVVATYSDETTKTLTSSEYYLDKYTADFTSTTEVVFTVTLYEAVQSGSIKTAELSITPVADYITSFTAAQKMTDDEPSTTYIKGETAINVNQFDFTATSFAVQAVTEQNKTIASGVEIFDTPAKVPAGYPSNTLRVYFRLTADKDVTAYIDIPLAEKASE